MGLGPTVSSRAPGAATANLIEQPIGRGTAGGQGNTSAANTAATNRQANANPEPAQPTGRVGGMRMFANMNGPRLPPVPDIFRNAANTVSELGRSLWNNVSATLSTNTQRTRATSDDLSEYEPVFEETEFVDNETVESGSSSLDESDLVRTARAKSDATDSTDSSVNSLEEFEITADNQPVEGEVATPQFLPAGDFVSRMSGGGIENDDTDVAIAVRQDENLMAVLELFALNGGRIEFVGGSDVTTSRSTMVVNGEENVIRMSAHHLTGMHEAVDLNDLVQSLRQALDMPFEGEANAAANAPPVVETILPRPPQPAAPTPAETETNADVDLVTEATDTVEGNIDLDDIAKTTQARLFR